MLLPPVAYPQGVSTCPDTPLNFSVYSPKKTYFRNNLIYECLFFCNVKCTVLNLKTCVLIFWVLTFRMQLQASHLPQADPISEKFFIHPCMLLVLHCSSNMGNSVQAVEVYKISTLCASETLTFSVKLLPRLIAGYYTYYMLECFFKAYVITEFFVGGSKSTITICPHAPIDARCS